MYGLPCKCNSCHAISILEENLEAAGPLDVDIIRVAGCCRLVKVLLTDDPTAEMLLDQHKKQSQEAAQ